jgi:hypothetical protein
MEKKSIKLPVKLANELLNINWEKVTDKDIETLIKIGIPFLKLKGYYKKKEDK